MDTSDFVLSPSQPGEDFKPEGTLAPKKQEESAYERNVPQPIKNAIGGVESAGRMLWNVPAGAVAGGMGALGRLAGGGDMNSAMAGMAEAAEKVHIGPLTKAGGVADEMLEKGYDYVKRDVVAEAMLELDRVEYKNLTGKDLPPEMEASRRSLYEGSFDAVAFGGLIKQGIGTGRAIREQRAKLLQEEKKAEQEKVAQAKEQQTQQAYGQGRLNQLELDFAPEGSLIPPGIRSPYNLTREQIAKAEAELNPPTERRAAEQSELFTEYRPADENLMGPAQRGARDQILPPQDRIQPGLQDATVETRQYGGAREMSSYDSGLFEKPAARPSEPIPYRNVNELTDFGEVGAKRAAALEERANARLQEAPIEPSPELKKWFSVPKSQRGGLYFSEAAKDSMSPKSPYKRAFSWIKSKWPRFSEVKDIIVLSKEEWANATKNHGIVGADTWAYMNKKDGVIFMPEGYTSVKELTKIMAHELRHGFDHGRKPSSGKGSEYWIPKPGKYKNDLEIWKSIPAEQKAINAEAAVERKLAGQGGRLVDPRTTALRGPGKWQAGVLNFGGDIKKKGVVPALMDFKTQFNVERRPIKEVISQDQIKPESITDIAATDTGMRQGLERLWKEGLSNTLIDKTMSILAASRGDVGKIVKWAVDQRRQVTREKDIRIREREEAMLIPWKQFKNRAELQEMKEVWLDSIGKDPLTRESFKTDKQWETFKTIQDTLKAGWEETNKWRKVAGLKPIPYLNNYFPSIRQGEYWVRVTDQLGNEKWSGAAKTMFEAKKMEKALKEEFSGDGLVVGKPYQRGKGQYELTDLSAFEETLKVLEKNDPITQKIQARYAELAGKRGFGRTGIFRKGIPGALGFEKGELGLRNTEKVLEHYVKRQEAYIANLKIGQLRREFAEVPKEITDRMPMGRDYINEYFNHSIGMDMDRLPAIKGLMGKVTGELGLGRDAPQNFTRHLSGTASLMWLSNMKFVLSQFLQPTIALPKLMQMYNIEHPTRIPLVESGAHALKNSFEGLRRWHTRSADSKPLADWAAQHGYLDSAIVALLGLKATDIKGQQWGVVGAAVRIPMARIEREMVRGPVLMMFDSALKDSIKEPTKRWEVAAELMDYYMTHYDRESSPIVYNKAGIAGDMIRPLKQYSHNNFGQFFEYLQTAKNLKDAEPLAAYMGIQALAGGMKGIILVAEATFIINALNTLWPSLEIPTPEEWLLREGFPDELVYGIPSNIIGADISSSVAAPSMPSMFSSAPIEFGYEAIASALNYGTKMLAGKDTDADALRAALALSPKAMHGWLEELYTQPGGPVPKPKQGMKGTYRRSDDDRGFWMLSEQNQARLFSLKSVSEARADAVARVTKGLLARDMEQKISALDAIADRIMNNKPITSELLQKYIEEGGDAKNLIQSVKDRIINRTLTHEETMYKGKQITPNRAHKLERMRELLDERKDTFLKPETKEEKAESGFKKMSWTDKANDFTEPKDGAMRPYLQIRNPKQEHLDDGAEYSRRQRAENQQKMLQRWETTNIMKLVARAKKLYPNNLEKQRQYLLDHDVLEQFQKSGTSEFIDKIQEKDPNIKKEIML